MTYLLFFPLFQAKKGDKKLSLKSKLVEMKGSCLYQVPISDNFVRQKYGDLYKKLSADGIIPLGVLRCPSANFEGGEEYFVYVYDFWFIFSYSFVLYRFGRFRSWKSWCPLGEAELRLYEP